MTTHIEHYGEKFGDDEYGFKTVNGTRNNKPCVVLMFKGNTVAIFDTQEQADKEIQKRVSEYLARYNAN